MKELADENPSLEEEIVSVTEEGNRLETEGKYEEALSFYQKAFSKLPEPKLEWEMLSQWIAGSFFNTYFKMANFNVAKDWAEIAFNAKSSDIDTGPLIDLGMVCFELNQHDEAYKYFDAAYSFGKARAFKERPKKYLDFYLDKKKVK